MNEEIVDYSNNSGDELHISSRIQTNSNENPTHTTESDTHSKQPSSTTTQNSSLNTRTERPLSHRSSVNQDRVSSHGQPVKRINDFHNENSKSIKEFNDSPRGGYTSRYRRWQPINPEINDFVPADHAHQAIGTSSNTTDSTTHTRSSHYRPSPRHSSYDYHADHHSKPNHNYIEDIQCALCHQQGHSEENCCQNPVNKTRDICYDFLFHRCQKGNRCRYLHCSEKDYNQYIGPLTSRRTKHNQVTLPPPQTTNTHTEVHDPPPEPPQEVKQDTPPPSDSSTVTKEIHHYLSFFYKYNLFPNTGKFKEFEMKIRKKIFEKEKHDHALTTSETYKIHRYIFLYLINYEQYKKSMAKMYHRFLAHHENSATENKIDEYKQSFLSLYNKYIKDTTESSPHPIEGESKEASIGVSTMNSENSHPPESDV